MFTRWRICFSAAISLLCVSLTGLDSRALGGQSDPSQSRANLPLSAPPPSAGQQQFLPYWSTETGWDTEIQLRNNQSNAVLTVTPVLRAADGTETTLQPVTVSPQDVKVVDVASAIAGVAPQLVGAYGSVVLRYSASTPGALFSMAMVRGIGHSFAFHIDPSAQVPSYAMGSREGIWWLPAGTTNDWLVLTNERNQTMPLDLSIYDASGKEFRQSMVLAPAAAARYSVRELAAAGGLSGTYGGIKVSAAKQAGSLDTVHVLFDERAGFSALLKMTDNNPATKLSERDFAQTGEWTLRAPMLALSNPDPALAFPPGTTLHPQLFIRNTTPRPATVSLRFNWRSASATGKAAGPTLQLAPYQTQRVDVAAIQSAGMLPSQANWSSITLVTNALPGSIAAVAASYDSSLKYGAQTPFSDQLAYQWVGSLWEYDAFHDSIITVGNGGTKPTQAAFTVSYNGGTKSYELNQTLQPDDQMWIDVGKLISEHIPDKDGNVLPENLSTGSYEIRQPGELGVGSLFEGKVVYDKMYGHVTYGCATCCGLKEWQLTYDPLGIPLDGTAQQSVEGVNNCQGTWTDITGYFNGGSWNTANHVIATVNSNGLHSGASEGSTTTSTCSKNNMAVWENFDHCPLEPVCPDSATDNTEQCDFTITPNSSILAQCDGLTLNKTTFTANINLSECQVVPSQSSCSFGVTSNPPGSVYYEASYSSANIETYLANCIEAYEASAPYGQNVAGTYTFGMTLKFYTVTTPVGHSVSGNVQCK
jgi:hypothetical protein